MCHQGHQKYWVYLNLSLSLSLPVCRHLNGSDMSNTSFWLRVTLGATIAAMLGFALYRAFSRHKWCTRTIHADKHTLHFLRSVLALPNHCDLTRVWSPVGYSDTTEFSSFFFFSAGLLCFYYENLPTLLFDLHWSTPRDVFPTCFERNNIEKWFNRLRFELYRDCNVFKTLGNQYGSRIYSMWMYSNSYSVSEVSIQTHLSVGSIIQFYLSQFRKCTLI